MKRINRWLRNLQQQKDRRLTPVEKYSIRLGYLSTAFIMLSPHLIPYGNVGYTTYVIGGVLGLPQVLVAKQWNLVLLNLNVVVAYGLMLNY